MSSDAPLAVRVCAAALAVALGLWSPSLASPDEAGDEGKHAEREARMMRARLDQVMLDLTPEGVVQWADELRDSADEAEGEEAAEEEAAEEEDEEATEEEEEVIEEPDPVLGDGADGGADGGSSQPGLAMVVQILRETTGTDIVVDWPALRAAGVSARQPVQFPSGKPRFRDVLEQALVSAGGDLAYRIEGTVIFVSTRSQLAEPSVVSRAPRGGDAEANARALAALRRNLPEADYQKGYALAEVLENVGEISGVPVEPDWDALKAAGVGPDTHVYLTRLRNVKTSQVLSLMLRTIERDPGAELQFAVRDGAVVVSTREAFDRDVATESFDVTDLVGGPAGDADAADAVVGNRAERVAGLMNTIMRDVAPGTWDGGGGDGEGDPARSLSESGGRLTVTHMPEVVEQVRALVESIKRWEPGTAAAESSD